MLGFLFLLFFFSSFGVFFPFFGYHICGPCHPSQALTLIADSGQIIIPNLSAFQGKYVKSVQWHFWHSWEAEVKPVSMGRQGVALPAEAQTSQFDLCIVAAGRFNTADDEETKLNPTEHCSPPPCIPNVNEGFARELKRGSGRNESVAIGECSWALNQYRARC